MYYVLQLRDQGDLITYSSFFVWEMQAAGFNCKARTHVARK